MATESTYEAKLKIRTVKSGLINIGGDSSISFMSENNNHTRPFFALEIPYFIDKNYPDIIKNFWKKDIKDFETLFNEAAKTDCDLICIHFNFDEKTIKSDLDKTIEIVSKLAENTNKPLILKGTKNKNLDKILLPKFAKSIKKECIIASADDNTYENIIPGAIENNHTLVLRSPIDINLAKEINILSMDMGLPLDKILIDSEMGALGYGLDYGYSIVEKIRLAGLEGDNMLNMPVIAFVGEEIYKTKEAKSNNFSKNWGDLEQRAIMWEITTASGIISAGANITVLCHPKSISTLKELLCN